MLQIYEWEQNYKIFREYEVCLLKRKFRCRPWRLGSREPGQSLKGSSSREVKLPGTRSSGEEWFAPLTVTERRMLLTRDLKQLAPGKGLQSCTAKHLTVVQAVQTRLQQTPDVGSQERPLSGTPILLQKGVMGFFPSVWQSPNPFSSRGKSWRLGYQVT